MMARGETSLPQFGQVGFPDSETVGAGGGGAMAVPALLRMASAGAGGGGGGATNPAGAGTVICDWQAGQGICIPAYSGPH